MLLTKFTYSCSGDAVLLLDCEMASNGMKFELDTTQQTGESQDGGVAQLQRMLDWSERERVHFAPTI
jgi:hypothetical protein